MQSPRAFEKGKEDRVITRTGMGKDSLFDVSVFGFLLMSMVLSLQTIEYDQKCERVHLRTIIYVIDS